MDLALNDLYYYTSVVEFGGFTQASAALGIPKSKLSRRISALEKQFDVRLIHRSTHSFVVTEISESFYQQCKLAIDEAKSAQDLLCAVHSSAQGTLRIACPIALLHSSVQSILVDFLMQNSAINIQLIATNRAVDVISEGFDLALRVRPLPLEDSELMMRVFGYSTLALVASPELLERYPMPQSPIDLLTFPMVVNSEHSQNYSLTFFSDSGEKAIQHIRPRLVTSDIELLHQAVCDGIGAARLPLDLVEKEVAAGSLQPILSDWHFPTMVVHGVYPSRRGVLPSLQKLLNFLTQHLSSRYKKSL